MVRRLDLMVLALLCIGSAMAKRAAVEIKPNLASRSALSEQLTTRQTLMNSSESRPSKPAETTTDAATRELLHLMGLGAMSDQVMETVKPQLRSIITSAAPEAEREKFMEEFSRKFRARLNEDEIIKAEIPVYTSHFSLDEIRALTQFYESKAGQRLVAALPEISRQSQAAAGGVSRKALLDTFREMSGEYPALKKMLPTQ